MSSAVMVMAGAMAPMASLWPRGSSFTEFNGLAAAPSSHLSMPSSSRPAVLREVLTIEAYKGGRQPTKTEKHKVRARRMRKKLNGTAEKPRLAIFRSNQHVYAQVVDDTRKQILASSSTLSTEIRGAIDATSDTTLESAKKVGEAIGKLCVERGIHQVAFDRQDYFYKGRIKALADAASEAGLQF